MVIQLVGDVHLNDSNPISRTDNYYEAIMKKLDFILSQKFDVCIFSGDIFNKITVSKFHLKRVLDLFYKYNNKQIYSIVGNHDVLFGDIKYLDSSPIGILFASGLIKHLDVLSLDNFVFLGNDYGVDLPISPNVVKSFLVAHRYFEYGEPNEIMMSSDVKKYDYVYLGHDHEEYPQLPLGKSLLLRTGSVCRNSSKDILKQPKITHFDTTTEQITYLNIPIIKNVFNESRISIKHEIKDIKKNEVQKFSIDDVFKEGFESYSSNVKDRFMSLWNVPVV